MLKSLEDRGAEFISIFGKKGVGGLPERKGILPKGTFSQQEVFWDDAEDAAYCHFSGALSQVWR